MIGSDFRANHDVRVLSEVGQVQRCSRDSSSIYFERCLKELRNTSIISRH